MACFRATSKPRGIILKSFTRSSHLKASFIIAVPNHESYDVEFYRDSWAALDVPLHLFHFPKENTIDLANLYGF